MYFAHTVLLLYPWRIYIRMSQSVENAVFIVLNADATKSPINASTHLTSYSSVANLMT